MKFILGARRFRRIFIKLKVRGYGQPVAHQAWRWLDALGGFDTGDPDLHTPEVSEDEKKVNAAMGAVDDWDEPNFRLMNSALKRAFPEQHAFLFAGDIRAAKGPMAVYGVRTIIARLDELESSPARKATREQDKAALARLAERGITKAERNRVQALLDIIGSEDDTLVGDDDGPVISDVKRKNTLIKLREWYEEWSEVARVAIKQKRDLMHLGLAKQKKASGDDGEEEDEGEEGGGGGVPSPA